MSTNNIHTNNYVGDRVTDSIFKGWGCFAVLNRKGKCISGKNGNMLAQRSDGPGIVVVARLLRKIKL